MDFQKGGYETLRVQATKYKGKTYIACRVYVPSKEDSAVLIPTKKGVSLYPSLARQAAQEMLRLADELEPLGEVEPEGE